MHSTIGRRLLSASRSSLSLGWQAFDEASIEMMASVSLVVPAYSRIASDASIFSLLVQESHCERPSLPPNRIRPRFVCRNRPCRAAPGCLRVDADHHDIGVSGLPQADGAP